ncbi:MAG: cardiolipin synthase [Clostridia bacterium]|nr:cardiolipin synthase [Clostridia bacterium]
MSRKKNKLPRRHKKWFYALRRQRFAIIFLLLIQFILLGVLIFNSSRASEYVSYLLQAISLAVCVGIVAGEDKQAYKIAWIFLILLLPVFGGLFYLLFKWQTSKKRVSKHFAKYEDNTKPYFRMGEDKLHLIESELPDQLPAARYLQKTEGFPVYTNTKTVYFPLGELWHKDILIELERAEKYIFLEYYIIEEGKFWDSVYGILVRKAAQGVDVRIIYDDIGCFLTLPKKYNKMLESAGIQCVVFNKFKPIVSGLQNNRDHRKIASIDGKVAYTGGCNIADEYINEKQKHGHWKDCSIKLEGEAAWSLTLIFLQMWSACKNTHEDYASLYPYGDAPCDIQSDGFVQPYADSPLDKDNVGENVYLGIIQNAKKYLYINTPYLIPDENILSALLLCAQSGVDVKIITPEVWDKKFVHMTSRSYYRELMAAGVEIYEYSGGFNHSKTFLSDDRVATVGTTNLDYRSLYMNFECGVRLAGTSTVESIKEDFARTLATCKKITPEDCRARLPLRITQDVLRLFAPLM